MNTQPCSSEGDGNISDNWEDTSDGIIKMQKLIHSINFFSINILSNKMVLGDKRTFKVVDVRKHGGCDTKFKGGRFVSRTAGAARKAFNALCRVKKSVVFAHSLLL